jgi:hypothetical protein
MASYIPRTTVSAVTKHFVCSAAAFTAEEALAMGSPLLRLLLVVVEVRR